ncbi:MAG TPA: carbamate kinase [Methylomirabilota bacterium]|nr:carbamate kinase [Methylomirabilota bacterium]
MSGPRDPRLLVVALGGGALEAAGSPARPAEWLRCLGRTLPPLVDLIAAGFRLVVTHAGAPAVADLLGRPVPPAPPLSLDACGAGSEGALGYAIAQVLDNLCRARGLETPVAAVATRVLVDGAEAASEGPGTPVGPAYAPAEARRLRREHGWTLVEEPGRGYRRLVPRARPRRVLETEALRRLVAAGVLPVVGAGGVPVVETAVGYQGVEVRVEPDYTAALLGTALTADRTLFLTGAERVMVGWGTPRAIAVERIAAREARALLAAGEFPRAGIGAKLEAALEFVGAGGREAVITSVAHARAALDGRAGTRVVA